VAGFRPPSEVLVAARKTDMHVHRFSFVVGVPDCLGGGPGWQRQDCGGLPLAVGALVRGRWYSCPAMRVQRRAVVGQRVFRLTVLAALLTLMVVLLGHFAGASSNGLLFMLPALVLGAVLFCGRYPGERVIERLRAGRAPRSRERTAGVPCPRWRATEVPRGGSLIARSLASRPPPLAAGCC
jgi:hypothetical protein